MYHVIVFLLGFSAVTAYADSPVKPGPVVNASYAEECGACHYAYPPQLLPARSWEKIMMGLDRHFGENAELSPVLLESISRYLSENAARENSRWTGRADTPVRITELPGFLREHDELPVRMVQGNPQVASYSNCSACHSRAGEASFREGEVRIPGFGRWED